MNLAHGWRVRLGLLMTVTLALQPVSFAVCQVNCLSHSAAVMTRTSAKVDAGACHEHAAAIQENTEATAHSVAAIHLCLHQPIPSLKRAIQKIERPASAFVVVSVGRLEVATQARGLPLRVTHAPPDHATHRTDVLRL